MAQEKIVKTYKEFKAQVFWLRIERLLNGLEVPVMNEADMKVLWEIATGFTARAYQGTDTTQ